MSDPVPLPNQSLPIDSLPPAPPILPTVPSIPTPKNKSSNDLIILIILILFVVIGVLAYQYYRLKTQTTALTPNTSLDFPPISEQVDSPELTYEQDVSLDPIVNWETYQDPQFNYSIQYPTNLIVQHEEGNTVFINDNKASDDDCVGGGCHKGTFTIRMLIQSIITQKELAIIANEEYKSANIIAGKDITPLQLKDFNGFSSYYFEAAGDGLSREYIFRLNPDTIIILSYTYISEDYRNTVDQILSTFKFIE